VHQENILSEGKGEIIKSLEEKGASKIFTKFFSFCLKLLPMEDVKYIFDQSGMDHELIGHINNFLN